MFLTIVRVRGDNRNNSYISRTNSSNSNSINNKKYIVDCDVEMVTMIKGNEHDDDDGQCDKIIIIIIIIK